MTRTFVELEVSESTFEEIFGLLEAAEYQHAFMAGHKGKTTLIDMHGIALKRKPLEAEAETDAMCKECGSYPAEFGHADSCSLS